MDILFLTLYFLKTAVHALEASIEMRRVSLHSPLQWHFCDVCALFLALMKCGCGQIDGGGLSTHGSIQQAWQQPGGRCGVCH